MFDMIPLNARERNLFDYFDNLEKNLFGNAFGSAFKTMQGQFQADIVDQGGNLELRAELPGFAKEDIQVDVEQGVLTIRAQKEESEEEKQENFVRRERRYGAYSRSFDITGIDADRIAGTYENGILTLQLPKLEEIPAPPARRIALQ